MVWMDGSAEKLRGLWILPLGWALLVASCQIPLTAPSASGGVRLSFVIAGQGPSSTSRTAVPARLLLPTVNTLNATMTSGGTSVSRTAPLVSGASLVTLDFGKIAVGTYTVQAQGLDSSGVVQFQQTGTLNLTETSSVITLNLVPAFASGTNSVSDGQVYAGTILAGQALSWSVPPSALGSGGYNLRLASAPTVLVYPQDSDGALIAGASVSGTQAVPVKNSTSSFLTLYNSGLVDQTYQFVVNQQVNGGTIIVNPANNPVTITGPTAVFIGIGTKFSAGYTGTATFTWYFDGVSKGTGAVQVFTPSPADFGNHVLMVIATDSASQLSYSTTFAVNVSNIPGLAGEWLFAGNANDTSVNGNNGTLVGAPTPTLASDRFGVAGHAYSFSPGGAILLNSLPLPNSGGYGTPKNYTISAWIDTTISSATNGQYIFAQMNTNLSGLTVYNGCYNDPGLNLGGSNLVNQYIFPATVTQTPVSSVGSVPSGVWTHIVATRTGSDRKLYVNNVLVAEDSINDDTFPTTSTGGGLTGGYPTNPTFAQSAIDMALIGNNYTSGSAWGFQGSIDDLRIYNQELTPTQINALYHEGGY